MTRLSALPAVAAAPALALGIALVLGLGAAPALAAGGDITRGALFGIAGGIALDELAHQNRPRNYVYVERPRPRPVVRYVRAVPIGPSPLASAFMTEGPALRVDIQRNLRARGLYAGGLDGRWGPGTEAALHTFARRHGQVSLLATRRGSERLFAEILA